MQIETNHTTKDGWARLVIFDGPRWIAVQARGDTVQVARHKGGGLIGLQAIERWPDMTFDELEAKLFPQPQPQTELEKAMQNPELAAAMQREAAALDAQETLLRRMRELSEAFTCSGWASGIEYTLWNLVAASDGGMLYGYLIGEGEAAAWYNLAIRAGGWYAWDHRERGPVFVPINEWRNRFALWKAHRTPPGHSGDANQNVDAELERGMC